MEIIHIINSLSTGGSERCLLRLISQDKANRHIVITLLPGGELKDKFTKYSTIKIFNFKRTPISSLIKLYQYLKGKDASIVQTWLNHANLIGGLIAFIAGKKVIWNIRNSLENYWEYGIQHIILNIFSCFFSYFIPRKIIFCSKKSLDSYCKFGYCISKTLLITNGVDTDIFKPRLDQEKDKLYSYFSNGEKRLTMIANWMPQKNFDLLIKSLSLVKNQNVNFKCIMIGREITNENYILKNLIKDYDLENNIILFGYVSNTNQLIRHFDYNILCSNSEGFPNGLIEAMSSGVPCISTDVGDAKEIISNTGWICKINDSKSLSESILEALNESEENHLKRRLLCRQRVIRNYKLIRICNEYINLYNYIIKQNHYF